MNLTKPAPDMSVRSRIGAGVVGIAIALASITLTKPSEGDRRVAYMDGTSTWTICRGHTRGVKRGDVATAAQCDAYEIDDMRRAYESVASCLKVDLPTNVLAAFIDFEFNTGRFCGSSIERLANQGKIKEACKAIGLYMYAGGKDCRIKSSNCSGIVKRRTAQIALCWPDFAAVNSGVQTWP